MSMNFIISPTDITGNKIIFLSLSALLRHPCWVVNNAATFVCVGDCSRRVWSRLQLTKTNPQMGKISSALCDTKFRAVFNKLD